jgi:Ca-activated chloride channel homolog
MMVRVAGFLFIVLAIAPELTVEPTYGYAVPPGLKFGPAVATQAPPAQTQTPNGPAAHAEGPRERDDVHVAIVSPNARDFLVGATELRADITPAAAVRSVSFSVDGREVCMVSSPPFRCEWDAGREVRQRQVRLAVTLTDGTRVFRVVRSNGLGFVDTSDVEAVQVTVTVTKDGKFVQGLPRTAFRIREDGQPQAINSFASEDVPLELIVAIDISGSMSEAMPKLRAAVKEFLAAIPPTSQVTLLGFNDSVIAVTRKATDPAERVRAVDRLSPWGATSLYDAIAQGVETLGRQPGRKALVVFTDGEDQGSHLTINEAERRLQASDVTLYMIGQGRGVSAVPLQRIMERLANPTGGRALFTDSIDRLRGAFKEILLELSHQYLVGYQSTNRTRDGKWRELKVEVDGPWRVRARNGYRAGRTN